MKKHAEKHEQNGRKIQKKNPEKLDSLFYEEIPSYEDIIGQENLQG
jgi:hypothetical protein